MDAVKCVVVAALTLFAVVTENLDMKIGFAAYAAYVVAVAAA